MQQHVDRARPLWETWVVEGLEGNRFALISKVHHCMIDGISGVDIMQLLMSQTPDYELETPPAYIPRPVPSQAELLRDELTRRATLPLQALRDFGQFASESEDLQRELQVAVQGDRERARRQPGIGERDADQRSRSVRTAASTG